MRFVFCIAILVFTLVGKTSAQQFQELIHPGIKQKPQHIEHAVGGGYLLASNFTDSSGEKSILLTRFDNVLNIVWHKTIDEAGTTEHVNSFAQDASGNIFIAGNTEDSSATTLYQSIVIKTDSSGNLIWEKKLNYSGYNNFASRILPVASGSIYVVGKAEDDIDNEVAYRQYLLKLSSTGAIQFSRDYPDSWHTTIPTQILKTSDNQLMVSGWSLTINGNQTGLTKFDTAGHYLWDHRWFGGYSLSSVPNNMIHIGNDHYILSGMKTIDSGGYYYRNFIANCDADGNMIDLNDYGFSTGSPWRYLSFLSSIQTSDGGYASAGYLYSDQPYGAIVLFKVDSDLNLQWSMMYDSASSSTVIIDPYVQSFVSLLQTADGGFVMAASRDNDILLIKTDANGFSLCNEQPQPAFYYPVTEGTTGELVDFQNFSFSSLSYQPTANLEANAQSNDTLCYVYTSSEQTDETLSFELYPNPANDIVNIFYSDHLAKPATLSIINMFGERVKRLSLVNETSIDISKLPEGIYSVVSDDGENFAERKLLKVSR